MSGLKIEYWYHALTALGAAGLIASVTFEFHGIANSHALLISLGCFSIGLGEWVNHPLQSGILPRTAYQPGFIVTCYPRKAQPIGIFFDALGFVLMAIGVYKIAAAS